MSVQIDIRLKRANKVYNPGDLIKGIVCLDCPTDYKHEGITLTMDGIVNLNTSPQNVGLIDTNILKPVQIAFAVVEIAGRSKIPAGITEIPFEIPLQPRQNRVLYETFHGVYININYRLKCDIKRSFLAKDISKELEFVVEHKDHIHDSSLLNKLKNSKVNFTITPNTLLFHSHNNVPVPHFSVEVVLHSTYCDITVPFTGELQIIEKVTTIESIELQLVRVETCGSARNFARESTEIQNIQLVEGDLSKRVKIPIYMIFPRLFSCPTLVTKNFKIEFEINLTIIFAGKRLVTENFPIYLVRL